MNLLKTLIPEFFVRSKEQSICPCCSGCLKSIGSRIRKVKDSFGDTIKLRIKRLRCRICNKQKKEINVGEDISWGFTVDSVDEKMDFLKKKGIDILSGPFSPNPHAKFFFILDPNGMKIQFYESVG